VIRQQEKLAAQSVGSRQISNRVGEDDTKPRISTLLEVPMCHK
jgi:hypothetical protein